MELAAAVTLIALAFALGLLAGVALLARRTPVAAGFVAPVVPVAPPAPAPRLARGAVEPSPAPPGVAERFVDQADAIAWHVFPEEAQEQLRCGVRDLVVAVGTEGWALGVSELRARLVSESGLPAQLVEEAVALAIEALDAP